MHLNNLLEITHIGVEGGKIGGQVIRLASLHKRLLCILSLLENLFLSPLLNNLYLTAFLPLFSHVFYRKPSMMPPTIPVWA